MSDDIPNWKREAAAELTQKRGLLLERRRKEDEAHKIRMRQIDDELSELSVSARSLGLPVSWIHTPEQNETLPSNLGFPPINLNRLLGGIPPSGSGSSFKNMTLAMLERSYPDPLKAAAVQEAIEFATGAKYHEKTAGMTLYRLSREGLARREGHWWYFVPEDQRNKENPGSGDQPDDPGLFNS